MQIEQCAITEIRPYHHNARQNDPAVQPVAESIRLYGFRQPIVVDPQGVIIVGHTRFRAAQQLKMTHVPVHRVELTDAQCRAYRLADNRTAQYADWDQELLRNELRSLDQEVSDLQQFTQFTQEELDQLLREDTQFQPHQGDRTHQDTATVKPRRMAMVVLKNSYVNRGVATYVNGWLEWCLRNRVQVDVISDSADANCRQFDRYRSTVRWIAAEDQVQAPKDDYFTLHKPIIRLTDAVKLRSSLQQAFSEHVYDVIQCQTVECLLTVISMGMPLHHPRVMYTTHSVGDIQQDQTRANWIGRMAQQLLQVQPVHVLCQSAWMQSEIQLQTAQPPERCHAVTPFLAQPELMQQPPAQPNPRVLFIGPWEQRKGAEVFVDVVHRAGLEACIITPSDGSARKWRQQLQAKQIPHEIHVGLAGDSKTRVIAQCGAAFLPSESETFCYTAIEAACCVPTMIPADRAWSQTHREWCHLVKPEDYVDQLKQLTQSPRNPQHLESIQASQQQAEQQAHTIFPQKTDQRLIHDVLTKHLEQHGRCEVGKFFRERFSGTRSRQALDELWYASKLIQQQGYRFEHTRDKTWIIKD